MSGERLLSLYDQVIDAPEAIGPLRRFVLDLAAHGKLVAQDKNDVPADRLLDEVESARAELVKAGGMRERPRMPEVTPDEQPYEIPETWRWARLANLIDFNAGMTPPRQDESMWKPAVHNWVSIGDMTDGAVLSSTRECVSERARTQIFVDAPEPPGTLLMSFKLTIGKMARLGIPAYHNEAIISVRPFLPAFDGYLFKILPQRARAGETRGAIKGATLNRNSISNILIPVAPIAEQQRIVAKIDEVMTLAGQLETSLEASRTHRAHLLRALLDRAL